MSILISVNFDTRREKLDLLLDLALGRPRKHENEEAWDFMCGEYTSFDEKSNRNKITYSYMWQAFIHGKWS